MREVKLCVSLSRIAWLRAGTLTTYPAAPLSCVLKKLPRLKMYRALRLSLPPNAMSSLFTKLKPWNGVERTRETVFSSTPGQSVAPLIGSVMSVSVELFPGVGFPAEMPYGPKRVSAAIASALAPVGKQLARVASPAGVGVNPPVLYKVLAERIS